MLFVCVCGLLYDRKCRWKFSICVRLYMWHVMGHTHRCMSSEDAHVAKEIELEFAFNQTHQQTHT